MGMPALYLTALSAVLLAYADFQEWNAFLLLGMACLAGAAIALAAKKHSHWATLSAVAALVLSDAFIRSSSTDLGPLHSSVSLGDFGYAAFIFATIGWIGGRLLRTHHSGADKFPMAKAEPQNAFMQTSAIFVAPSRTRRRSA